MTLLDQLRERRATARTAAEAVLTRAAETGEQMTAEDLAEHSRAVAEEREAADAIALPSDFQPGVPSPVSRASLSVCDVIGTVWPPACSTRVWFRARSNHPAAQRRRHQVGACRQGALGQGALVVGAGPVAGRQAHQVSPERHRLVEPAVSAGAAPVGD